MLHASPDGFCRAPADLTERDAALQVIARPVQPAADVLTACEAVLAFPRDWIDFERARLLRIAVRREGVAA
jgi:hypothetical protein